MKSNIVSDTTKLIVSCLIFFISMFIGWKVLAIGTIVLIGTVFYVFNKLFVNAMGKEWLYKFNDHIEKNRSKTWKKGKYATSFIYTMVTPMVIIGIMMILILVVCMLFVF